jgi:hypothetical protein
MMQRSTVRSSLSGGGEAHQHQAGERWTGRCAMQGGLARRYVELGAFAPQPRSEPIHPRLSTADRLCSRLLAE